MKKNNRAGLYIILGLIGIIVFSALISNVLPKKEEVKFNKVSYSEYKELFKSTELEFVYVGRAGCGYCQATVPLLGQLQKEEDVLFNYLDTDTMSESDFKDIGNTADVFKGEWGTPTLLAIKDGKVLNTVSGYKEIEALRTFITSSKEGKTLDNTTSGE